MILVNKKVIERSQLEKVLGIRIPFDKIIKKPLYEINPELIKKDPANGPGATKHRNAMQFPAMFHTTLKDGSNAEIRYCTNATPDPKFMGQTQKYTPKYVDFDDKAEFIPDDADKAVYFWLHFFNKQSPFRKPAVPFEYELVDDEGKANDLIAAITLRSKATTHASQLSGEEMRIIAKGMNIAGVKNMDELMIRAQLMQFANDKPAEYLSKAQSQVNHIEGLIRDAIDKEIFVLESIYNAKRWKWGMGVKAGSFIVELSSSIQDESQALITHISQHINEFLPVLIDTAKTINAKSNLAKQAENIDVFAMLKQDQVLTSNTANPEPFEFNADKLEDELTGFKEEEDSDEIPEFAEDFDPLPTSFDEAKQYLGRKIGKKTPSLASQLIRGIEDGSITEKNIDLKLEEFRELSS